MAVPAETYRLEKISPKAYEHPADRAATAALASIPYLDAVIRKLIELGEWFRSSELSCDRAAALVTRDPLAVCRTLMTMAAGTAADDLDLDAFLRQAAEWDEGATGLDWLSRRGMELQGTHPLAVRR